MTPWDSINLLGVAHRTQGNVTLLDHQFIIKRYNSESVRWKRCIEQGIGVAPEDSMPFLSIPLSLNFHT